MLKDNFQGLIYNFASVFPTCLISGLVAYANNIDSLTKSFARFFFGVAIILLFTCSGKLKLKFTNKPALFLRGIFGSLGIIASIVVIDKLGIGQGTVIFYTYPIFVSVFSVFIFKEKLNILKWIAILLSTISTIVLVAGIYNIHSMNFYLSFYYIVGIFGAIFTGIAIASIRKLHETDNSVSIFFSLCIVGVLMTTFPLKGKIGFNIIDYFLLLLMGLASTLRQLLMTWGYKYTTPTKGVAVCLIVPCINMLQGVFFFNEKITITEFICSTLIVISTAIIILPQNKTKIRVLKMPEEKVFYNETTIY